MRRNPHRGGPRRKPQAVTNKSSSNLRNTGMIHSLARASIESDNDLSEQPHITGSHPFITRPRDTYSTINAFRLRLEDIQRKWSSVPLVEITHNDLDTYGFIAEDLGPLIPPPPPNTPNEIYPRLEDELVDPGKCCLIYYKLSCRC